MFMAAGLVTYVQEAASHRTTPQLPSLVDSGPSGRVKHDSVKHPLPPRVVLLDIGSSRSEQPN